MTDKRRSLVEAALRAKLPSWVPDEVVQSQVDRLLVSGMNRSDYENLDTLLGPITEYARNNPSRARDMQGRATPMEVAELQAGLDTRFNQNPRAYWPFGSTVTFPKEGQRVPARATGFVSSDEPSTAYITGNPESFPDTVAHELHHTKGEGLDLQKSFFETVSQEERDSFIKDVSKFVESDKLPANALANTEELFAALVGRESMIPKGKSALDDEVLGVALSNKYPSLRDWYMKNRFKSEGFK